MPFILCLQCADQIIHLGIDVHVRCINTVDDVTFQAHLSSKELDNSAKKHLLWMKEQVNQANVLQFIGVTDVKDKTFIVGNDIVCTAV